MNLEKYIENLPFKILKTSDGEELEVYHVGIDNNTSTDFVRIEGNYKPHIHNESDAYLHIIRGNGTITINDKSIQYKAGSEFNIPKGNAHGFITKERTVFLAFQNPPITEGNHVDISYPNEGGEK